MYTSQRNSCLANSHRRSGQTNYVKMLQSMMAFSSSSSSSSKHILILGRRLFFGSFFCSLVFFFIDSSIINIQPTNLFRILCHADVLTALLCPIVAAVYHFFHSAHCLRPYFQHLKHTRTYPCDDRR